MRRNWRSQKGFTLIEMMVVLAIIALIAVFAIPSIVNALQNSRIKSVEAQARQIQNAFDEYYHDWNKYPPAYDADANNNYNAGQGYDYFFDADGALQQYVSLPESVGDALFIPREYSVTQSDVSLDPTYEFVLEVKNVNTDQRYIHITKGAVTRDESAGAATDGTDFIED